MQERDVAKPAQDRKPVPAFKVISGVIERINYQDEETGYTVARFLPDPPRRAPEANGEAQPVEKIPTGEDHLVTVIGMLLGVVAGEALELTGFWQHHTKHGWQFSVQNYRSVLPATIQGLRKYLGSGLIKGIGPKTDEKIVARFDLETLDILEHSQERLLEVPGLGQKRAKRIAVSWEEQKAIKEVMVCLQGLGVSTSLAVSIYEEPATKEAGAPLHMIRPSRCILWGYDRQYTTNHSLSCCFSCNKSNTMG